MAGRVNRWTLRGSALVLTSAGFAAMPGGAPAALPAECQQVANTVTCTYSTPSAAAVQFTVPAGVTELSVQMEGASGGNGGA